MTTPPTTTSPRRRLTCTVGITALLMGLALVAPAGAQTPSARDITDPPATSSCPVDRSVEPSATPVPEDGFADVAADNVHEFAIDCTSWYGITLGTSASTYDPGGSVRREQVASFIARLLDYAADGEHAGSQGPGQSLPAAPAENQFPCDVDTTSTHYEAVQRLAAAGIVEGTGTDSDGEACFNPGGNVSRAQMASFIEEAEVYADQTRLAVADFDPFVDDDNDIHEDKINSITQNGITNGIGTDSQGRPLYGPELDVKRDQMASFLARTLDLLVEEGVTASPSAI